MPKRRRLFSLWMSSYNKLIQSALLGCKLETSRDFFHNDNCSFFIYVLATCGETLHLYTNDIFNNHRATNITVACYIVDNSTMEIHPEAFKSSQNMIRNFKLEECESISNSKNVHFTYLPPLPSLVRWKSCHVAGFLTNGPVFQYWLLACRLSAYDKIFWMITKQVKFWNGFLTTLITEHRSQYWIWVEMRWLGYPISDKAFSTIILHFS